MSTPCIIGIDIGGTNFRIGAVDGKNQVSRFRKIPTGTVFCTTDGLKDLEMYLKEYMETLSGDGMAPRALAVGFPATLNRERTMVLQAPMWLLWKICRCRRFCQKRLAFRCILSGT